MPHTPPSNPTPEQKARHDRRHPADGTPKQPHPGNAFVTVSFGQRTRQFQVPEALAPLFKDGGFDADAFHALSPAEQYRASTISTVDNFLRMDSNPNRNAVAQWGEGMLDDNPNFTSSPCPDGLSGVVYMPAVK